jgi:ATP-dependent Zn protease
MSRSRIKTPITGNAANAKSEKADKQKANRVLRARVRVALNNDAEVMPELREVSEVYTFAKDGKSYFDADAQPKLLRK